MTAKVENYCASLKDKSVTISPSEHACINCIWYEQYYRKNRGNVSCMIATSTGYCLLKAEGRGALRQPCERFEREEE